MVSWLPLTSHDMLLHQVGAGMRLHLRLQRPLPLVLLVNSM
jgi:hypothetical protein